MKSRKYDNIIAIDPDISKSGVAFLKPSTKQLEVSNLTFPQVVDYLNQAKSVRDKTGETLIVLVEASWLIKGIWHLSSWERRQRAASKGYDVGRNHETGKKIVEMCQHLEIEVLEHYPLRKCWKGKDGKITHEELSSFTGLTGRTNQDARDAALLAWSFANLPIRLKLNN
uniref:HOLLIDAY JUNCTION RESOLVASE n=1 Tax=Siphoviridae sp. ctnks32 TaxID=2826457 RepID=A0A8S5N145_9CAUD|nr:MAG TPA: HOLLIDAY JUNCTION RESOLVASE [Siphoviridae sp. ctnks32]